MRDYIVIESNHPEPSEVNCDYMPAFRINSEAIYNYIKTVNEDILDDWREHLKGGIHEWKDEGVEDNLKSLLVKISDFLDFDVYLCHLSWTETDEWDGYQAEDLLPHSKLWSDWRDR